MSGLKVNVPVTLVSLGSTCLVVDCVNVAPAVVVPSENVPPVLKVEMDPTGVPVTVMDVVVILPEVAAALRVTPVAVDNGWAVVNITLPAGALLPEAVSVVNCIAPTEEA